MISHVSQTGSGARSGPRVRLTREQSRQLTQERLKQAALQEFAFTGIAGASIDRIAESAGYSRGAFYANYASKNDLLLALLGEHSHREVARWRALMPTAGSGEHLAQLIAERFAQFIQESNWGLFAIEAQLQAQRDAEFAVHHSALREEVLAQVKDLVASHFVVAGKQVPADMAQLNIALYSLATGLVLNLDPADPARDAAAAGRMLARFILALVQSAPDALPAKPAKPRASKTTRPVPAKRQTGP